MPIRRCILNRGFLFWAGLALLSGCATDGGSGRRLVVTLPVDGAGLITGTGFEAAGVKVACSAMQRGLDSVPVLARARQAVKIVVEPVVNDTRYALNTAVFNRAVREQLAAWAPRQRRFLAAASESDGVGFYLAGRLQHLRPLAPTNGGVTLLYSFQLIDASNSEIVWEGTAELKNRAFHESSPP